MFYLVTVTRAARLKRVPLSDAFENCCLLHALLRGIVLTEVSEQSSTMDSSLRLKPELLKLSWPWDSFLYLFIYWHHSECIPPPLSDFFGFPGGSDGKESAYNAGDSGLIPGSGRSLGNWNGNPFQYSYLENPMDRGAWRATVHRVTKSRIRLKWLWLSTQASFRSGHPSFRLWNIAL